MLAASLLDTRCTHQGHLSSPDSAAGSTSASSGRDPSEQNTKSTVINRTSIKGTSEKGKKVMPG